MKLCPLSKADWISTLESEILPLKSNFCVLRKIEADRKSAKKALLLSNIIAAFLKKIEITNKTFKTCSCHKIEIFLSQVWYSRTLLFNILSH